MHSTYLHLEHSIHVHMVYIPVAVHLTNTYLHMSILHSHFLHILNPTYTFPLDIHTECTCLLQRQPMHLSTAHTHPAHIHSSHLTHIQQIPTSHTENVYICVKGKIYTCSAHGHTAYVHISHLTYTLYTHTHTCPTNTHTPYMHTP